jgi:hypothetical protein
MVALDENFRFAMAIPARFNITRLVTPTVPRRGSGSQFGLGISSIICNPPEISERSIGVRSPEPGFRAPLAARRARPIRGLGTVQEPLRPENTAAAHLAFALKHEGVHLETLSRLFAVVSITLHGRRAASMSHRSTSPMA